MPDLKFNKTRIAPTPSGFLHPGNVLSFILTKTLAKRTGAKILLRIDDLDQERVRREYVEDIFDTLDFLEIGWDEGPRNYDDYFKNFSQVHRMDNYTNALQQLLEKQSVFACTCSRSMYNGTYDGRCVASDTSLHAPGTSWRLRTENAGPVKIGTLDGIKEQELPEEIKNFVVRKKDGRAAYQLSSLVDDLYFGVDLIVRGRDLWPSTLAQTHLAQVLKRREFDAVTFHHHDLVNDGTEKLSKSAGALSVQHLRKQHKKPRDIYNIIAKAVGITDFISSEKELTDRLLPAAYH